MAYIIAPDNQIVLSTPVRIAPLPNKVDPMAWATGLERGVPGSDEDPYPASLGVVPQLRIYRTPLTEETIPVVDNLTGLMVPLVWAEVTLDDGTLVYAKVDLPDPASYFGGFKEARLLSVGAIKRALSDRMGNYEAAQFGATFSDFDRKIRGKLASQVTKWFMNRFVTLRMISDEGRRAGRVPRTIAIGYLRDYAPISPLQFSITCEDYLALFVGLGQNEKQIPKRTISKADFPSCPNEVVGKAVPIIYGRMTDEATSGITTPVITGTPSRGAILNDPAYPLAGYGDLPLGLADRPTNVVVSATAGGSLSLDVPNSEYGAIVTAVDANGVETDPCTFYYNGYNGGRGRFSDGPMAYAEVTAGNQTIHVSWDPAAGAAKYRVYLAWYYYGARFNQCLEVVGTSCDFTAGGGWMETGAATTPGNIGVTFGAMWWYAVTAVAADGSESAKSTTVFGASGPFRRHVRIEWAAVAGAVAYRVYRRSVTTSWDRRWDVSAAATYFDDDQLDTGVNYITAAAPAGGLVGVTYVGQRNVSSFLWDTFLVAGHAVAAIDSVFTGGVKIDPGSYGVTWLVPGKPGWPLATPYADINGHRYTLIYVRGPESAAAIDGSKPITLNVQGIEDKGDSTGTLLTDGFEVYLHLMRNWILQDYQAGDWFSSGPTWPAAFGVTAVEVLDDASFAAAKANTDTRIAGGYQAALILGGSGTQDTVRTWIQRFNLGLDCWQGFSRKMQFFVKVIDTSSETLAAAMRYRQTTDIHRGSFLTTDMNREMENVVVYSYGRDYPRNAWLHESQEAQDSPSIAGSLQTKRSQTIENWVAPQGNSLMAYDVATRRLMRTKEPPRIVVFRTGLQALNTELGDVIRVTHLEGIGAGGWTDRPIFVTRHELDPDKLTIALEGIDVDRLFTGGFLLGSEVVLPASWAAATTVQREYGFLCDETTGQFSDGAAGKRLR